MLNLVIALVFGWALSEKEATEISERRTAELLRQSQARALQNQLEPHVLYNALNSLSELIHDDPLAAEEVIARLADLYRTLTRHGMQDHVRMAEERRLVEAYLSMEQMRLGERLLVFWDWPSWADDLVLPPLFLQPLVENAVKHGISPSEAGGELRILCNRQNDTVILSVLNSGVPLPEEAGTGIGLANLRARLALWTRTSSTFNLDSKDGWTRAVLTWKPEQEAIRNAD